MVIAAVAALKRAGVWEQVREKIVYAENISMAKQFGSSGNADVVLTAYSLVDSRTRHRDQNRSRSLSAH